jgi:hypothetical protein
LPVRTPLSLLIEWIDRGISRPGSRRYLWRKSDYSHASQQSVFSYHRLHPGTPRAHMLSGIIAYQVLRQENPQTIERVKAVLEKHPWYTNQWQARLQDVPAADHSIVLFMQAV